ncbi:MAG TPA: metallophosphoesterase [Thermoanaerobaculia bacterium]|nr:metallophosphoesterase [Thermoanaerobaculia bacterium]
MLFLVSDLHLTDCSRRSTFDFRAFEQTLRQVVAQAAAERAGSLKIVLNGDIFEMLKTSVWLDERVRPWHAASPKRAAAVTKIMSNIIGANPDFFALLNDVCLENRFVSLVYVPGNHDYMLNADDGNEARELLRKTILLGDTDDRYFKEDYQDPDHQLVALHGHQWDDHNIYREDTKPIGDVIVIELLTRLPILLAHHLGLSPDDRRLSFVHEIDNVIPQTPQAMARWLTRGLDELAQAGLDAKAIDRALVDALDAFTTALRSARFEGADIVGERWRDFLTEVASLAISKWGALRIALPFGSNDLRESYADRAAETVQSLAEEDLDYRFVAYGHTHACETVVIAGATEPHIYFNLGTWRRSHRMTGFAAGTASVDFASCIENTYVIVRTPQEATDGRPRYTFSSSLYAC